MSDRLFNRAKMIEALRALGAELTRRGVRGQVYVVGGAAMTLAYSSRRVTRDIDAVFEPKAIIYDAAALVAAELQLPDDWLNDGAKAFVPGSDPDARPLPEVEGIEIAVASARFLLAMKLMAMRFGEDEEDIVLLMREVGVQSAGQALALLERLYPFREPPLKTRLYLDEIFSPSPPAT